MSLETWKAEFYPEDAALFYTEQRSALEAVEHSLRKWRGLLPENLAKHGVEKDGIGIKETRRISCKERFWFRAENCALCEWSLKARDGGETPMDEECDCCPLQGCAHEYRAAIYGNPTPMIRLLESAREKLIAEGEV